MSGPLEELRAAVARVDRAYNANSADKVHAAWEQVVIAARALLAASGAGERPADGEERTREILRGAGIEDHHGGDGESYYRRPAWHMAEELVAYWNELGGMDRYIHHADEITPAPTPPDAGTGTPSDDGRAEPEAVTVAALGGNSVDLIPADGAGLVLHVHGGEREVADYPTDSAVGFAAHQIPVLAAALARFTPAAPSGTTGATTRDERDFAGSSKARQEVGDPGHCERCVEVGHVAAHPTLGCGDVGCDKAHGPTPSSTGATTGDES